MSVISHCLSSNLYFFKFIYQRHAFWISKATQAGFILSIACYFLNYCVVGLLGQPCWFLTDFPVEFSLVLYWFQSYTAFLLDNFQSPYYYSLLTMHTKNILSRSLAVYIQGVPMVRVRRIALLFVEVWINISEKNCTEWLCVLYFLKLISTIQGVSQKQSRFSLMDHPAYFANRCQI